MRIGYSMVVGLALSVAGCKGPSGPPLPPDVGANHTVGGERAEGEETPAPPAEPVEVGTPVWGDFHDTGFYFRGVVVQRRGDMHRVVYGDGADEWLPASALLPDALDVDARVHVRPSFEGEFQSATVLRRLGRALYVRLANGDETWTTLPHVRFQSSGDNVPARGDAPVSTAEGQLGADVLVNYHLEGLQFPGVVTARADDGRLHVVYLDGESEWVHGETARPDEVSAGTVVHVRRSWEPAEWARGTVQERFGSALRVQLDDGGVAWTSMFRVRVPLGDDDTAPAEAPSDAEASPDES